MKGRRRPKSSDTDPGGEKNPWGATTPPTTEAVFFNAARHTVMFLVEGGSDERFWTHWLDDGACQIRIMGGKENALREVHTAVGEGRGQVLAILDADFDRVRGTLHDLPQVFWTDDHDLEVMLIRSPALEKILTELGSRDKRKGVEAKHGRSASEMLFAHGLPLGKLRLLSILKELGLVTRKKDSKGDASFRYVPYGSFCDKENWTIEEGRMVQEVLNFSQRQDLKADALLEQASRIVGTPEQLCVGHDLLGILAVGLRKVLGSRNVSVDELQQNFRLAFEGSYLERTTLFSALRAWEITHPAYRILRSPIASQG